MDKRVGVEQRAILVPSRWGWPGGWDAVGWVADSDVGQSCRGGVGLLWGCYERHAARNSGNGRNRRIDPLETKNPVKIGFLACLRGF